MSDPQNTQDEASGSSEETPMIPEELVPRQESDDPVANDSDATGPAHDNRRDADDEDDDKIDLNDLA